MPVGLDRTKQVQRITLRIDEVDISSRSVHGYDKSNVLVVATWRETPNGIIRVPAQNERWIAQREGMGQWRLVGRLDSADDQSWIEANLGPGDVLFKAPNLWFTGTVHGISAAVGSNLYAINQTAHGFVIGNVLYYTGSAYALAQADTADHAEVVGIVSSVVDANNFILLVAGEVAGLSGLTAGTTYFLDDATAGALTATQPSTGGHISKPLGIAVSTTALFFYNFRGEVIQAGAGTQVTTSAWSSGPPSNASDGDIWIASAVDANGTRWQFQYNAGSASAYKWEFIGGPSLTSGPSGSMTVTTTGQNNLTSGPSITTGRGGDYLIELGIQVQSNSGQGETAVQINGSSAGLFTSPAIVTLSSSALYTYYGYASGRINSQAAQTYNIQVAIASAGISVAFSNGSLKVTPVRIS